MPLWVTKGTARPEHSSAAFAPAPKIGVAGIYSVELAQVLIEPPASVPTTTTQGSYRDAVMRISMSISGRAISARTQLLLGS
jgi:hypothetical protein